MASSVALLSLLCVVPIWTSAISVTHYDKPTRVSPMTKAEMNEKNVSLANSERQRRLIPYMTYYVSQGAHKPLAQYRLVPQKPVAVAPQTKYIIANYQPKYLRPVAPTTPKLLYSPFVETNKLPVQFAPAHPHALRLTYEHDKEPDYGAVYEKLLALKQQKQNEPHLPREYATQSSAIKFLLDRYPQQQGHYKPPGQYKTIPEPKPQEYRPIYADQHYELVTEAYKTLQIPVEIPKLLKPLPETVTYNQEIYKAATPAPQLKLIPELIRTQLKNNLDNIKSNAEPFRPRPIQYVPSRVQVKTTREEVKPVPDLQHVKQFKPAQPEIVDDRKVPTRLPVQIFKPRPPQQYHDHDYESNLRYQPVIVQVTPDPEPFQPILKPFKPSAQIEPQQVAEPVQVVYESTPRPKPKITQYQKETLTPPSPTKTVIHTYTPQEIDITNFESLKTNGPTPEPTVPAKKLEPIIVQTIYQPAPEPETEPESEPEQYPQVYYEQQYSQEPESTATTPQPALRPENPHSLSVILKHLQDSNMLPHTLTPDNIDNSIKTLVYILNTLKNNRKFQRPIVVAEQVEPQHGGSEDALPPHTLAQNYPDGGTPGRPGVDYPAFATIPHTRFNCKAQRYKGFFGDPETHCQVWHYCDLNGGQASFLCPNGTIFSQVALTCDWWYNVKCATTTQLYVLNERLYKYILPFNPKFPEDYSGPLVDRYLALKFQEMEEKMKKQKKGKDKDDTHNSDVDKLQVIEREGENKRDTSTDTKEAK